ncbi:Catechol 2,3-dioxygenase [Selenomonas ruminantium]|uniref:Catechol 2,3-dioxygenase n=1 Tax=Selenomonas ruminantium TaxID=971 RepID=A0A1I3GHL7_SELRU|nr:VOC family protein [Selenomonas ruminantium]SFI22927.1 Catechol 2,3-dioxygenase [Selenomonas ruminantium]
MQMTEEKAYIDHAAVTVADIQWSLAFFEEVLGMTVTRRRENDGKLQQVWLDGGIQLIEAPATVPSGQAHHLGIRVRDFKGTLAKMLAYEGVHPVAGKPEKWVQLPDGLLLELFPSEK